MTDNSTKRLVPRSALYQYATSPPTTTGWHRPDNTFEHNNQLEIHRIFEKKFHYQRRVDAEHIWQLPPPEQLLGEYYQLDTLQELKPKLNDVKCKLNDYPLEEWSLHTRRQDPSNEIPWRLKNETKAEFVTVAWCKFFECLHSYPLVKGAKLNSLHLCELPGAFIAALNHYMYSTYEKDEVQWRWLSTTLNPYYEGNPTSGMITDDRFMFHTFDNWLMHDDFTGNIINRGNIEQLQTQCRERLQNNVQLITADGSIDCADAPDCQEEVVASLHFAEIATALTILAEGGCFVIKMFTLYEATNVCKLFLLNCVFDDVHVYKPATSKRGNSEVYVICVGYRKGTPHLKEILQVMIANVECANILPLFPKAHLPKDFLIQHEICARLFMNLQIESIEANIQAYEFKPTKRQVAYKQQLRTEIANEFYRRYKVCSIPEENKVLYGRPKRDETYQSAPFCRGSYSEREMAKITTLEERIFALHRALDILEKALDNKDVLSYGAERVKSVNATRDIIRLCHGAPFSELQSSMFAHPYIMQMYQKLKELFGCDPLHTTAPTCTVDGKVIAISANDMLSFSLLPRQFFVELIDAISKKPPRLVIFANAAFLTHFCVSILRFLGSHIFDSLNIFAGDQHFSIELQSKGEEYTPEQAENLEKVRVAISADSNVLCILPLEELHRNEFSNALHNYNNQLLLMNFKLALKN